MASIVGLKTKDGVNMNLLKVEDNIVKTKGSVLNKKLGVVEFITTPFLYLKFKQ